MASPECQEKFLQKSAKMICFLAENHIGAMRVQEAQKKAAPTRERPHFFSSLLVF
jgi:hypothetical protein